MSEIYNRTKEELDRMKACFEFCEGAPTEALQPGGLMKSFKDLAPSGKFSNRLLLALAVEHQRVKAENVRLRGWISSSLCAGHRASCYSLLSGVCNCGLDEILKPKGGEA